VTDRTPSLLVCVYYRVAADDAERASSAVREFQRTLLWRGRAIEAEVLLRCDLPLAATAPDDAALPPDTDAPPPPGADATVMETYRLPLPARAGEPAAEAELQAFLDALAVAAQPLAGLLRGKRHVEPFRPCA
jgi:hypothetical protein